MSKAPKMIVCRTCNNTIAADAKVCPHCGAKVKKPIYKRWWFIALVVLIIIGAIGSAGGGDKEQPTNVPATTSGVSTSTPANEADATNDTTTELVDGMRPEFKESMDSYEAYCDKYCDFMKKYKANPNDLGLLSELGGMLEELSDMEENFAKWEGEDMNDAEMKYYLEVSSRVASKMLEVAG